MPLEIIVLKKYTYMPMNMYGKAIWKLVANDTFKVTKLKWMEYLQID